MGNKIVALLLLVCLVIGNVEGGSYPEEECFKNCHLELDGKHSVIYVNGACMMRCVKWTAGASTLGVKAGSRKDGPVGYGASTLGVKDGLRKDGSFGFQGASTTEVKAGSRKDRPLGYQASKTKLKDSSRKNGPLESPTSASVSRPKNN